MLYLSLSWVKGVEGNCTNHSECHMPAPYVKWLRLTYPALHLGDFHPAGTFLLHMVVIRRRAAEFRNAYPDSCSSKFWDIWYIQQHQQFWGARCIQHCNFKSGFKEQSLPLSLHSPKPDRCWAADAHSQKPTRASPPEGCSKGRANSPLKLDLPFFQPKPLPILYLSYRQP